MEEIWIKIVKKQQTAFGDKFVDIKYIQWLPEMWREWSAFDPKDPFNVEITAEGENQFGVVPYTKSESPFSMLDICASERRILFKKMANITNTVKTAKMNYSVSGITGSEDVDFDEGVIMAFGDNAKVDILGTEPQTFQVLKEDLDKEEMNLRRALYLPDEAQLSQSGIAKREDKQSFYNALIDYAEKWEQIDNFLGSLYFSRDDYKAQYPNKNSDFIIESESELLDMIEKGKDKGLPAALIKSWERKLAAITDKNLSDEIDFDEHPTISRERAETCQIATAWLDEATKAEFIGIDESKVIRAQNSEDARAINRDRQVFGNPDNQEPEEEEEQAS